MLFDGNSAQVVEIDGRAVALRLADGSYRSVGLVEFAARARSLQPLQDGCADPWLVPAA